MTAAADDGDDAGRPVDGGGSLKFKGRFLDHVVNNSSVRIMWDEDDDTLMFGFLARHHITNKSQLDGLEEEMRELGTSLGYKHRAGKEAEKHWAAVRRRIKSSLEYKLDNKLRNNGKHFQTRLNADKTMEIHEWRPKYRKQCLREAKWVLEERQQGEDGGGEEQQPASVAAAAVSRAGDIMSSKGSDSGQDESDRSAMTGIIFYGAAREARQDESGRSAMVSGSAMIGRSAMAGRSATTGSRFANVIDISTDRSSTDSSSTESSTESSSDSSSSESGESESEGEGEGDVGDRGGDDNSCRLAAAEEVFRLRHRLIDRAARRRLALNGFGRGVTGGGGWHAGDAGDGDGQQLWEQLATAMSRLKPMDPLANHGVAMFLVQRAEEGYR